MKGNDSRIRQKISTLFLMILGGVMATAIFTHQLSANSIEGETAVVFITPTLHHDPHHNADCNRDRDYHPHANL